MSFMHLNAPDVECFKLEDSLQDEIRLSPQAGLQNLPEL